MDVHRAIAACPSCNENAEIWYYKGKIVPIHTVECINCSLLYEPTNFIIKLLDLYSNVTVSAIALANKAKS